LCADYSPSRIATCQLMPRSFVPVALVHAVIARVAEYVGLLAVQQRVRLCGIGFAAESAHVMKYDLKREQVDAAVE